MRRIFYTLPIAALAGLALSAQGATAANRPVALHVSPSGIASSRSQHRVVTHHDANGPSASTLWVSSTAPTGNDTSCSKPGYNTISAALSAAPSGATINVCGGTYTEQLAIVQSVHLVAHGSVTVAGPVSPADDLTSCDADGGASEPNQDIVDICGAGTVSIAGFTIHGDWPPSVCNDSLYGVNVLGRSDLVMSNSTVESVGGDPLAGTNACQGGVGIEVGEATSATAADAGSANLTNDVVKTYQKNGITVDGTGSSAVLKNDTVTGIGESPVIAQNGIQVSDGATATITGALVTGNECERMSDCGSGEFDVQSTGILLFDAGLTKVSNSTVNGNDDGIYNVEDLAWDYYTPPAPFTAVNEKFSNMTMNNRYENASFDAGTSSLSGSTLTGGETGLQVLQYDGQPIAAKATGTNDTITGTSVAAVQVESDMDTTDDLAVSLYLTKSDLDTSNAVGVDNESTSIVTATTDWWGNANGPSDWSFGSGSSVTSDVNFFPWSTNSGNSSFETCGTGSSQTTSGNDVVLCAPSGTGPAYLANGGSGNVLLIGNTGNDQLIGSVSGETWIIGGPNSNNFINGNGGNGFLQERGDTHDTLLGTSNYTIATS